MKKRIDRQKIKELVEKGLKDKEIAKILNCSPSTISQIRVNELNILRKAPRGEVEKKIIKTWERGYRSAYKIASIVGCLPSYVSAILIKHKLKKPGKQKEVKYYRLFEEVLKGPKTSIELKKLGLSIDAQRHSYKTLKLKNYPISFIKIDRGNYVFFYSPDFEKAKTLALTLTKNSYKISDIMNKKFI